MTLEIIADCKVSAPEEAFCLRMVRSRELCVFPWGLDITRLQRVNDFII
jgi:hypothetical protein